MNVLTTIATDNILSGYKNSIDKLNFAELRKMRDILLKIHNFAEKNANLLTRSIEAPTLKDLEKNVIAADGTSFEEEYEAISISIASAFAFCSNGTYEKYLPEIQLLPPYKSSLLRDLIMRSQEYEVTLSLLQSLLEIGYKVDLILIDGPLTFPDYEIESTSNPKWIKKGIQRFNKSANDLFNLIENIKSPIVGIVKGSQANKFFLSLARMKNPSHSDEIDYKMINDFDQKEWENGKQGQISEIIAIRELLRNSQHQFPKRTGTILVNRSLRKEPIINLLKDKGVTGFYMQITAESKPYFIETPSIFNNKLSEIARIIASLGTFSLAQGYPTPLFVAHKRVRLQTKKAKNLINLVKLVTRTRIPEFYNLLMSHKPHTIVE